MAHCMHGARVAHRVEVAEAKQNASGGRVHFFHLCLREAAKGALGVVLQPRRRLIRQLDAALQDADGNGIGWIGAEEEAELGVGASLFVVLQPLLQLMQPPGHEMHIVQQHPVPRLGGSLRWGARQQGEG